MGLFNKKKVQTGSCDCGGSCAPSSGNKTQASVKVLGSGCAKCKELEQNTITALQELNMDTSIHHTDYPIGRELCGSSWKADKVSGHFVWRSPAEAYRLGRLHNVRAEHYLP